MSAEARVEFVGLKDALRTLNKVDKDFRKQIAADYKVIVAPVIAEIKAELPSSAPMSGWKYPYRAGGSTPVWKGNEKSQVKSYISSKRPKSFSGFTTNLGVFGIRWNAPSATLFDMSHNSSNPEGISMIDTLNARFGNAKSRIMWKNWLTHKAMIETQMEALARRVMDRVNGELK